MEPPIFIIKPDHAHNNQIVLDKTESHHAYTVLRLRAGAIVIAVDGLGTAYRGEITKATGKSR